MKRTKSFVAGILSLIFNIGGIILNFLTAIVMLLITLMLAGVITGISEEFGATEGMLINVAGTVLFSLFIALFFVLAGGHLVSGILSIFGITSAKKPPEVYAKRKKVIITTIVFNFLVAIPSMVIGFVLLTSFVGFIWVVVAGVLIASNILWIFDIVQEKARVEQMNAPQPKVETVQEQPKDAVEEVKTEETKPVEQPTPAPVVEQPAKEEKVVEIAENTKPEKQTKTENKEEA